MRNPTSCSEPVWGFLCPPTAHGRNAARIQLTAIDPQQLVLGDEVREQNWIMLSCQRGMPTIWP